MNTPHKSTRKLHGSTLVLMVLSLPVITLVAYNMNVAASAKSDAQIVQLLGSHIGNWLVAGGIAGTLQFLLFHYWVCSENSASNLAKWSILFPSLGGVGWFFGMWVDLSYYLLFILNTEAFRQKIPRLLMMLILLVLPIATSKSPRLNFFQKVGIMIASQFFLGAWGRFAV